MPRGIYEDKSVTETIQGHIQEHGARLIRLGVGLFIGIIALICISKLFFNVNNHEVVALTFPNGSVEFYTQPGIYGQWLGHVEAFEKRQAYEFEERIQFNDGAHASIKGSVQYQIPLDMKALKKLYALYPSPESIQKGLIETNIQKAVYLTGRMMSSKESYAERRGDLLNYMEDQLSNGIYRTTTVQAEAPDPLDDKKTRTVAVTQIVSQNGAPARSEQGIGVVYGITTANFTMSVTYDPEVEQQIQVQQKLAQGIQTSIAEARQAEQRAITAAKNGEADAATAKWQQEKLNAKQQAESEQAVRTATQDRLAAEQNKQALILQGEGEAQKRQLIMNADGQLSQKLATYEKVQQMWASAFGSYQGNLVPTIQGAGGPGGNAGINLMELMGAKAAHDLALDLTVPAGRQKK